MCVGGTHKDFSLRLSSKKLASRFAGAVLLELCQCFYVIPSRNPLLTKNQTSLSNMAFLAFRYVGW